MKRFSFPKSSRLVSNSQFKAVLARKLRVANGLLVLYTAKNDCNWPRLGISVDKSCGSAVVRNRLKRLIREAFRQSREQIPAGFDYLVMISPQWQKKTANSPEPKKAAKQLTLEMVQKSFLEYEVVYPDHRWKY